MKIIVVIIFCKNNKKIIKYEKLAIKKLKTFI